tara:strand:- start:162 stop:389 length:228 start_codon:yes stop_codon:yes gene_type:complete
MTIGQYDSKKGTSIPAVVAINPKKIISGMVYLDSNPPILAPMIPLAITPAVGDVTQIDVKDTATRSGLNPRAYIR